MLEQSLCEARCVETNDNPETLNDVLLKEQRIFDIDSEHKKFLNRIKNLFFEANRMTKKPQSASPHQLILDFFELREIAENFSL